MGNDYERLRAECSKAYGGVKECLRRDWRHIDDAQGYRRSEGSFNRMKRCRHGVFLFNPLDWYIGRGLEVYGEWGEKKVQIWRKVVKAGQVVVDIGAHIGSLTLPLSELVGLAGRVVAFEPFYPSYATLAGNVGLNSLQNVELRQAVVGARMGKVFMNRDSLAFGMHDFFNFGSMNFNSLRIYNTTEDVERPSTVWDEYHVVPLDHLSLTRLDFVKVDAEAMELAVLEGAKRVIKRFKPIIFLEYRNPWEKDTRVLDFLQSKLKYECVLLRIPVFNPQNYHNRSEDIWSTKTKLVSFNLLCKHRWWEYSDLDVEVLELFDTAVDTDIEGLRTTPLADPFESMTLSGSDGFPAAVGDAARPDIGNRAAPSSASSLSASSDELTLDELLSEEPATGVATGKHPVRKVTAAPPPSGSQHSGLAPAPSSWTGREAPRQGRKAQQDRSPPPREDRPPPVGGTGGTKAPPRTAANGGAGAYRDVTLDELLDDLEPDSADRRTDAMRNNGAGGARSEDALLEELLGPEPVASPRPARKQEEEDLTLDELLAGSAGWNSNEGLTLDELLGGPEEDERDRRQKEEMTLDELLGPDDAEVQRLENIPLEERIFGSRDKGEKDEGQPFIDELLGDASDVPRLDPKYEDMSLDELLALDDPIPTTKKTKEPEKKTERTEKKAKKDKSGKVENKMKKEKANKVQHKVKQERKEKLEKSVKYEEISLDELLALEDPIPLAEQQKPAREPGAASKGRIEASTTSQGPQKKQAKPKQASKAAKHSSGQAPERVASLTSAGGGVPAAGRPHVRVTYEDELTLDDL